MTDKEMWAKYLEINPEADSYVSWPFGGGSPECTDELAALTLAGIKTATAGPLPAYEAEHEPIPKPGVYSVILNSKGEAVCVIRTYSVEIVPFNEVSAEHAYLEGEDDRSLAAWRECHERVFSRELEEYNIGCDFTPDIKVVCERFKVVYPPRQSE